MNLIKLSALERSSFKTLLVLILIHWSAVTTGLQAQTNTITPTLQIRADQVVARVSPELYGLMTEEINYSYEGGLYGELIRNRSFKANTNSVTGWSPIGSGQIALDPVTGLNEALNVSLKLDASQATTEVPAGIANGGYWGIPVRPNTSYHLTFFAKAASDFSGNLTASLINADNKANYASVTIMGMTGDWKHYAVDLTTKNVPTSKDNLLQITTTTPGTIWFQQVSLFPPTFESRPNGNRPDLMKLLADMKPAFLRLPGGNYLEGNYLETRFNWKKTIGDISQRPGHESPWGYWSTDGFGLMEYLCWCEELHMEPLLAVFAGYSLKHDYIKPGRDLEPYVQDALDEIAYITGDTNTIWGALRARDGHPAPFPLHYVEVGNEDWFDRSGSYEGRFAQFFNAIKTRYPQLQIIATTGVKSVAPDLLDEHYYRSEEEMEAHAHDYDLYTRTNHTKIFVGEWATRVGSPTPNMAGALGDGAWMTGMERNSDIVLMSSYAPMFVNVSDLQTGGSMQWRSDLIGYDALGSYGSPSYYAQKMFSTRHGDQVLATSAEGIPTYTWQPRTRRLNGVVRPRPPMQQVPTLFFDATRDSYSGRIYLKIVNRLGTAQRVRIKISGVASIKKKGLATVLHADRPDDTNSILEPEKIVPQTERIKGLSTDFNREFPPYSITVLELATKS
jgi:alpha-N-arabinofuranosidase